MQDCRCCDRDSEGYGTSGHAEESPGLCTWQLESTCRDSIASPNPRNKRTINRILIDILPLMRLTMDFKWSDLEPKPNNWLGLVLRYEGVGSAEFVSPEGTIRGKGVATFDEYGNSTVEIECESFSIDPQYTGGPVGFLFGSKVEETQGKKTMAFGGFDNPCKTLSINCRRGVPCEQYR